MLLVTWVYDRPDRPINYKDDEERLIAVRIPG